MGVQLISDIWTQPNIAREIREAEQRKYRQGYRNGRNINGTETYILTVEELVSVFDISQQEQARREAEFIAKLRSFAQPYEFGFYIDIHSIKLFIKNSMTGEFANRFIDRLNDRTGGPPEEVEYLRAITNMKMELEIIHPAPAPLPPVHVVPLPPVHVVPKPPEPKPAEKETEVKVKDKRSGTGRPLNCPEHGNFMVPVEPGVLRCPVPTCTKIARKKGYGASFKKPEPAVVEDIKAMKAKMEQPPTVQQTAGEVIQNIIQGTTDAFGQLKFPPGVNLHFPNTSINLTKNDNPVKLFIDDTSGMFLMQNDQAGNLVCIDITSAHPNVKQHVQNIEGRAGLRETTVVLNLDQ